MKIRILKSKADLESFETEIGFHHYMNPEEYPCIAISARKDARVDWHEHGFNIFYSNDLRFLYPKQIQKDLFSEDFDKLVGKK